MYSDSENVPTAHAQAKFLVKGYSNSNIREIEKILSELTGVYHVNIRESDGETTIDYNPFQTSLASVSTILEKRGLENTFLPYV